MIYFSIAGFTDALYIIQLLSHLSLALPLSLCHTLWFFFPLFLLFFFPLSFFLSLPPWFSLLFFSSLPLKIRPVYFKIHMRFMQIKPWTFITQKCLFFLFMIWNIFLWIPRLCMFHPLGLTNRSTQVGDKPFHTWVCIVWTGNTFFYIYF